MARTTLIIPDALWREVKLRAAKENKNISEWVAGAIQLKIKPSGKTSPPGKKFESWWPSIPGGGNLPNPMTREWIYGATGDPARPWR